MNSAKRSPCAGSSGLMKTHVAIETATLTRLAVKQKVDNFVLFIIFFSLFNELIDYKHKKSGLHE